MKDKPGAFMVNFSTSLALILLLAGCSSVPAIRAVHPDSLLWTMEVDKSSGNVCFTLTNKTNDYFAVYELDTPFNVGPDGILNGNVLKVTHSEGKEVKYHGRLVHYLGADAKSVSVIGPRSARKVVISISRNYNLDPRSKVRIKPAANDLYVERFSDLTRLTEWARGVTSPDDFSGSATCWSDPGKPDMSE